MKILKHSIHILTLSLIVTAPSARAALLAYEGFNYTTSTPLNGLNGGAGWANAWSAPAAAVTAAGLGYTDGLGNSLVTTGSCAYFNTLANAANIQARRTNNFVRDDTVATTWVSFIGQYGGNDLTRSVGFQLHTNTTERLSIGKGTTNVPPPGTWSMLHGGAVANSVFTTNDITKVSFLVLRIDHHAGTNDDAFLFVNPLLNAEPNTNNASAVKILQAKYSFNAVRAFTAYVAPNYADLRLDEIRIGQTYADVTPYLPVTVVLNTNDSGPGSLRQAVLDAPAGGVITFTNTLSGSTIPLSSGQIVLNKNLTINGAALPNGVTISGGNVGRIFQVNSGATNSLLNLTLAGGNGVGSLASGSGGAIYNEGSLALTACTVSSNSCADGGGGIFSQNSSSRLAMTNCTVARNTASFAGGFLFRNSSIVSLVHCTVSTNLGTGGSGGIVLESSATLALQNTIIAGNPDIIGGEDIGGAGGTLTRSGNNLIGVQPASYTAVAPVGAPNVNGDYVGTSGSPVAARLAPLGNFGGPTLTMPPLPGSPAIDAGAATTLTTDQRGFTRTVGAAVDIGAVETGNAIPGFVAIVTTNSDAVDGDLVNGVSLREAVAFATNNATITFSNTLSGQTILLNNGTITVNKNLTIDGSALPGGISVNGNKQSTVFTFSSGASTLAGLTITNGWSVNAIGGGGIFVSSPTASLTVTNCAILGNVSTNSGGGIRSAGTLIVNNSRVAGNTATNGQGGGILCSGTTAINTCTFSNNFAYSGGGIYTYAAFTLNNSTLVSNVCSYTGGAFTGDPAASPVLLNSTFYGNIGYFGGAVVAQNLTATNCTFTGNQASYEGGALSLANGSAVFNQLTVTGNRSFTQPGGGITAYNQPVTLLNSIVASNTAPTVGKDIANYLTTFTFAGTNIVNSTQLGSGSFVGAAANRNVNPNLAPLGNYGGPTQTMPPLPGSPAINAGAVTALTTDQRGFDRVAGAAVDIGAVEFGNKVAGFTYGNVVNTNSDILDGSNTNFLSLRTAVFFATNNATITFAPNLSGQTILLTNGQITLTKSVTIDGSSLASAVQLNGNNANRIFQVNGGVAASLNSLVITNGYILFDDGGGIFNIGTLTVNNSSLVNNNSAFGDFGGGGIFNVGTLTVKNSTLANNSAQHSYGGGGIYNILGTLTVNNSTLVSNSATDGIGGGGGIYSDEGTLKLNNSTVAFNSAEEGGGIYIDLGTLALTNSIVCSNTAATPFSGPNMLNFSSFSSGANNLVDINALLAPFGNYGGPTQTMPPLPGSPAIDAGAATALTTDQRGFTRTIGTVDIGAVETGNAIPGFISIVTTNSDAVDGDLVNGVSLREAVAFATNNATITFAPNLSGQTILLTNGQITLTKNVTIDGSSLASAVQLNGNHASRIFYVNIGVTVTNNSLIITNGFSNNEGGGIYNEGTLTVNNSTIAGNVSGNSGNSGGGIFNLLGTLTVNNSTIANNVGGNSAYSVGGIYNFFGTLTVNNSTIAGNVSGNSSGGIFNFSGTLTVNNSTVANNSGGGIENEGTLKMTNSIVSANIGGNVGGSYSGSSNLVGVANINLAPLGNYGGPTPTMPPLPGSPAIDAGSDSVTNFLATDQGGFARKLGAHVDIGAVEAGVGFLGNGNSGFGGSIGQGSLTLVDDGTNIFGTLYRGPDTLRDDLVFYIDSVSGGFSNTASFADGGDGLRKAISGFDGGGNRSVLTNLPGFTADCAIALGPDSEHFGGLWRLTAGGTDSLQYSNSVNLSPLVNNAVAYTFSFPVASIGLQPGSGATFRFFGTLISSTGFRSDEALPGNVSGAQGWSPFNVTAVASYTIQGSLPVTSPFLTGSTRLGNGSFQFNFTNVAGANLTVWASTNVALPFAQWSNLGAPVESPAGTFTFTDPQAPNNAQRFYRVSSP